MTVDFKLVTYHEPITSEEQEYALIKSRNYAAYYPTKSGFIYDMNTKIIYDAIFCKEYRWVTHEKLLNLNGFYFKNNEESDNFIRLIYITEGCYDLKGNFLDKYRYNEFGIGGLAYSLIYYDHKNLQQRAENLKSYDLDILESYVDTLKKEQAEIRRTEINLNLPKKPDQRKKRKFIIGK